MKDFFSYNSYFIDQNVAFLKLANSYKIYNSQGEIIGAVKEKLTWRYKIIRLLLGKKNAPFTFHILDTEDNILATISRGWTLFVSQMTIKDAAHNIIGYIQQHFTFFKPYFEILNEVKAPIAKIEGDWMAWSFLIKDKEENIIGYIDKRWAGVLNEVFTNADKYNVRMGDYKLPIDDAMAMLSAAICIDFILKEISSK